MNQTKIKFALPRPPLGLIPAFIFWEKCNLKDESDREYRIECIGLAIARYDRAGKTIPEIWHQELERLVEM
ncbi:MAG: hypothetical protein AAGF26_20095 [Cyanobacteria bacterium P01_G01_bin.49]